MNELGNFFPQPLLDTIQTWDSNVLIITGASFITWIVWRMLFSRLEILVDRTRFHWDNLILEALKLPISVIIWVWPATISVGFLLKDRIDITWFSSLKLLIMIAVFIWIMMRFINNVEQHILKNSNRDETTVQAIAKVSRLFFIILGTLTAMQALGLSLSGLLTFGGVGGLVVGLAAKDLLSNFFGGMMIYFDRPFKVGDWIRSPDRQIEGTVERIGWRMTIIRTFDKRPLYVPNSVFSSIVVENPSRMHNRRIKENIGLRYEDERKVNLIVAEIKGMLSQHPEIDQRQTLIVNFNGYAPSSLTLLIYTFTKTTNWIKYHEVKQNILLEIGNIIHSHGAEIALPTHSVQIDSVPNLIQNSEL